MFRSRGTLQYKHQRPQVIWRELLVDAGAVAGYLGRHKFDDTEQGGPAKERRVTTAAPPTAPAW